MLSEFLRYNSASLGKGFNGTVRLLMDIPAVRNYIGSGSLVLISEGFITNTTSVGNYLVTNMMGIEYTMSVVTGNEMVTGMIYVKYVPFKIRRGGV